MARLIPLLLMATAAAPVSVASAQDLVVLTGWVRDTSTLLPVEGATVEVEQHGLSARTGVDGDFRLGPVLPGRYMIRFAASGFHARRFAITVPARSDRRVRLGVVALAVAPARSATVTGLVWDAGTKRPVNGARLTMNGVPAGFTDAAGRFRFTGLAYGAHRLDVLRIGYRPETVDLTFARRNPTDQLVIVLQPLPVRLADVEVTGSAPPVPAGLQTFLQRRERGWGHFITREQIERRAPMEMTSLLRGVPGLRVIPVGSRNLVRLRGPSFPTCQGPIVFLDGARLGPVEYLDDLVPVHLVAGMEIYTRATQIPPELKTMRSGCGVIVIWTRVGRSR